MPKRYPSEVREKAVRLALDRLDEYGSAHAAAQAIGPMVDVHPETLRVWIVKALQQQTPPAAPTAGELAATERAEVDRLRQENRRDHTTGNRRIPHPDQIRRSCFLLLRPKPRVILNVTQEGSLVAEVVQRLAS